WQQEVDQHFPARQRQGMRPGERMQQDPRERPGMPPRQGQQTGQQDDDRYRDTDPTRTATNIILSSDAIGMNVQNAQGTDLGTINNIVMDLQDASIVYAVIAKDAVLGMGGTHLAVPWEALSVRSGEDDERIMMLDV